MKKQVWLLGMAAVMSLGLAACNSSEESSAQKETQTEQKDTSAEKETQTITYLNQEYKIPKQVDTLAAASLESMEDAALLGVKPEGAITIAGKLPEYLAKDLEGAQSIGEKTQPNYETLLSMKPDVILGSSKFQPEVAEKLNKVATMIPVSHIATNWEDNLLLMGEITGTKEKAESILTQYKEDTEKAKEAIGDSVKDKKAVVVRVRAGNLFIYPVDVYFNPVLYQDLGMAVPEEIKAAKAQETISLEKFAAMNPDYVFLQFDKSENSQQPKALEELEGNAIWKSTQAVKDGHVFVNSVDPLAQGGTAWSKQAFLKAVQENLAK
ncbi:iron-hydroxamate ABC transporter substrate-binding protein [Bacillus massiliglaciei]|uniref:iron-hydroxamate ABC transporter substrate-binding protein n=1 Tax=Bacillus massiliglaciei TaxID=1816693 RepID=UPI000A72C8E1|nr:iron-hydroxamate ABC transporter substrate-binding protein [Bacillus massiliglaciei]